MNKKEKKILLGMIKWIGAANDNKDVVDVDYGLWLLSDAIEKDDWSHIEKEFTF